MSWFIIFRPVFKLVITRPNKRASVIHLLNHNLKTHLSAIFLVITWFGSRKGSCNNWCSDIHCCITINVFDVVHRFSHCEHFSLDKEFGITSFSERSGSRRIIVH